MRPKGFMTILSFTAGLLLAIASFAAEEKSEEMKSENAQKGAARTNQQQVQQQDGSPRSDFITANRLIGIDIESSQGEDVGEISDVLLHQKSGKVAYLIVSAGGFWGIGDTRHIIPFNAVTQEQNKFVLNIDREKLSRAPTWEPGMSEETFGQEVYEFFGVSPYWEEGSESAMGEKKGIRPENEK